MPVLIIRKSHPKHTSGACVQSPARLISGTTVPCLTPDMSTATPVDGIIVTWSLGSAIPAKRRSSRRAKRVSEIRANFAMLPAYPARHELQAAGSILPQAVNTPLARKAKEEMSDFEREYPW